MGGNGSVILKNNDVVEISENRGEGVTANREAEISGNGKVRINNNWSGVNNYNGGIVDISNNGEVEICNNESIAVNGDVTIRDNGAIILSGNGGAVRGDLELQNNEVVVITENSAKGNGGGIYGENIQIENNREVNLTGNRAESQNADIASGGLIYGSESVVLTGNGRMVIRNNAAISATDAWGGAIYGKKDVQVVGNAAVLLRGNYEQQGSDYRLRSIYACGNLELSANDGQEIKVYDSVYTGGNLVLNADGAGGEILLSGEHTEADLLAAKGSEGTMQEITNSRTNTVVGTTTLGGGVLRLEAGAILQTGGFSTVAESGAVVQLDNAVLNSSGYDVTIGSGTTLSVGGTNTLTAANFNLESGSALNIDLREKNRNLSALALNANMSIGGVNFSLENADVMAAGKYKLISLGAESHYDIGSWEGSLSSVTGADAGTLSWENGTLYYTSENTWIISATQDAEIIEAPEAGSDVVIGNGAAVELGTCLQGHLGCDNPKHGGRPGNPGQGHAHTKPGNNGNNGNGNNGNGNGNNGHGSLVIVEGSAYIKERGDFEGLLDFRGAKDEERHFYTEKDLGIAYITAYTDEDATSHLHIGKGTRTETEGIVGNGNIDKHGHGKLVLNGHDSENEEEASSSLYFGRLSVHEGAVRVEDDSQAYLAYTEVHGGENAAAMEVGRGAAMTGETLRVSGENATLHNDGSIAMSEGITVDGGTVKGSGTFSNLTMNGGRLVVGNSPGMQSYDGDLILGDDSELLFSVAGFENYATEGMSGWGADVYSSIDMGGNEFSISGEAGIILAFGADSLTALAESTTAHPLTFEMTLLQNVGNIATLDSETLSALVGITTFCMTDEAEGLPGWAMFLSGSDLTDYVSGVSYAIVGSNIVISGSIATNGAFAVPEPTTATLSLLALVGLVARRRRRA